MMHSFATPLPTFPDELADFYRVDASQRIDAQRRGALGQFLTPLPVARFMASLFDDVTGDVLLLDPGAGTGTLTAAFLHEMANRQRSPHRIHAVCYELDEAMTNYLASTLEACREFGKVNGVHFEGTVLQTDFIQWSAEKLALRGGFFEEPVPQFTHCIMNPPYKKIRRDSEHRAWLRKTGIETSNLYSGFLAMAIQLLAPGGELVAIVPRSFCNGPYFRSFRRFLLEKTAIQKLHVFEARNEAFKDDDVLQENVILHVVKGGYPDKVTITSSTGVDFSDMTQREAPFEQVIWPSDPDAIIHIVVSELDQMVIDRVNAFRMSLTDIGVEVSTGPVIDFRLQDEVQRYPETNAYPLIYPSHFRNGFIVWPDLMGKKPNSIRVSQRSRQWLMKNGWYVLTRRFSSKEERRRIVAALHSPHRVPGDMVGFENHLNVFHQGKEGLEPSIAKGLAVYLNSTLVDLYFRQFSGHTQVNATDLRALPYPDVAALQRLATLVTHTFPSQEQIDNLLDDIIDDMMDTKTRNPRPIRRRVQEALSILKALGLPKAQQNERSALTLLALIGLKPEMRWQEAEAPLMGITPIMEFIREHYGKQYAPNTRETIRRQTMHQFVEAGIAISNPDEPDRPINSPKWCYQITPETLALLRSFGDASWDEALKAYLERRPTLVEQYKQRRSQQLVPLRLPKGSTLLLTPGKHSELIKAIVEEFGPRFAPGAKALYVGDTGAKMLLFDEEAFRELGVSFDSHGKFPDVVLYSPEKRWLFLIEAVTSHGPVTAKRHAELSALFSTARAELIYVTAFPNRRLLARHLADISWETEVWVAESPSHLIHFDGERFLGPYTQTQSNERA